jgi:serine/threonine-protein kinase HipA
MTRTLTVFMGERRAGTISCDVRSSSFEYDLDYLGQRDSTPISLSMPLQPGVFPPTVVDPFLWGLLPDNADTLQRWAILATPPADEHNPFTLLEHYGRDCAGAIQFVRPQDVESVALSGSTQWLTEEEIGNQLRAIRDDPNAWTFDDSGGRFSLAGAQAKFALLRQGDKWGRPQGATPTTHIIKPGIPEFRASALNEHVCLTLAAASGLRAARSSIVEFDGESAIVVERYDRVMHDGQVSRLHQEDFCQALAVMPSQKYQDDGGPSLTRMSRLIRGAQRARPAAETSQRLLLATAFNWLIAGTDAHAKNYSLLLSQRQVGLAPLYDVASYAPYPKYDPERVRLAQSVGGEYRMAGIGLPQWREQAESLGVDSDVFAGALADLAETTAANIDLVCREDAALATDAEFTEQLREALTRRVESLLPQLT